MQFALQDSSSSNSKPDHQQSARQNLTREETTLNKSISEKSTRKQPARKRRSLVRTWIPNQHGAWMMVLCPPIAGLIVGGFSGFGLWLCVAWLACYLASFSVGRWLTARRARRYFAPAATYSLVAALIGVPLLCLRPTLLWWAPLYAVVLALHLWAAQVRQQRSLWANASAVLGSGLTALIAVALGPLGTDSSGHITWFIPTGIIVAGAYVLQEFGTVLFAKTMFRERQSTPYLVFSILWHLVMCGAGFAVNWVLGVTALLMLIRASILPAFALRLKPLHIGLFEVAASVIAFGGIIWGAILG